MLAIPIYAVKSGLRPTCLAKDIVNKRLRVMRLCKHMIILGVDNPPAITKTNTISRRSVYCGSSNKRLGHGPGCSGSKVVSPIIQVVLVFSTISSIVPFNPLAHH
jgi:hypothetical protein